MFGCFRMAYYAVAKGRQTGIFRSWFVNSLFSFYSISLFFRFRGECENQVKGFGGAVFKKFKSQQEAQAFVEGQPAAKKQKTTQGKINFTKAIDNITSTTTNSKRKATDGVDSDDELFLNLEEFPDSASSSVTPNEQKRKDPLAIKFEQPAPTTEKSYNGFKFMEDSNGFVHVYTDGSCESNGKYAAAAGVGVYFGENHALNISDPVTGRPTNNAGEIQAAIRAIQVAQTYKVKRLNIFTDSHFLINSVCKWMSAWKKKDWRLATGRKVVNQKDFQRLDELIESGNMLIKWSYIPAHKGFHGNEEADRLAKIGASLFRRKGKLESDDEDCDDYF